MKNHRPEEHLRHVHKVSHAEGRLATQGAADTEGEIDQVISVWLDSFNQALRDGDADRLRAHFLPDSHWRDLLALTWNIETISGRARIGQRLGAAGAACGARNFGIHRDRCPPRVVERAGVDVLEAILDFETDTGHGAGLVRFRFDADHATSATPPMAWTLLTSLEEIKGHEEASLRAQREEPPFARDFHGPNWQDQRRKAAAYVDRDPTVLVVGGGHAGVTAAARLGQLV